MSLRSRFAILAGAALACAAGLAGTAHSQIGGLNAEFSGGGARAMAMGGAFIALADDATATEFNPAGLWQLRRPEIALHARGVWEKTDSPFLDVSIDPPRMDWDERSNRYVVPSFASVVYPTQYVALGLSRMVNIGYERDYTSFTGDGKLRETVSNEVYGLTLASGAGAAFSLGASLRYGRFDYGISGGRAEQDFESDAFLGNAGLLWRASPKLRVGLVYKTTQGIEGRYAGMKIDTVLPDTIGIGAAYLPDADWRFAVDVDRIRWSRFDPDPRDAWEKEDVWRGHAGAERCLGEWSNTVLFLRAGAMVEESNAYLYRGENPYLRRANRAHDTRWRGTCGVGAVRDSYQLDLGFGCSEDSQVEAVASMVVYF